jgi:hypothetical protein
MRKLTVEQVGGSGCAQESYISLGAPPLNVRSQVSRCETFMSNIRFPSPAGQLAISDKTISRKHITIHVDNVPEGGGVRQIQ